MSCSSRKPIRVLFLSDDREDYLADGLLHGLKQLTNLDVTDFPKKNCLYRQESISRDSFEVRGGGFTLYGALKDTCSIADRQHIQQKLEHGWFDLIVIANIWRQWGLMIQWEHILKMGCKLAILDGDDDERFYPTSTTRFKHFGPTRWLKDLLNKKSTIYFKREWTNNTTQWPYSCMLSPLGFSIPEDKIVKMLTSKKRLFPNHVVDEEISYLVGAQTSYAFTSEMEYRNNLEESRFGITTKRGGWECLRHYEIAASGAIPCFRNLISKPLTCAPHGLVDGINCINYCNAQHLMHKINQLTTTDEESMREAALEWAKASSTKLRAIELLKTMKMDINT